MVRPLDAAPDTCHVTVQFRDRTRRRKAYLAMMEASLISWQFWLNGAVERTCMLQETGECSFTMARNPEHDYVRLAPSIVYIQVGAGCPALIVDRCLPHLPSHYAR